MVLVGAKFSSDIAFNQLQQRVFNNASVGQLQHSLTAFARSVESAFTRTEMFFGVAYLLLAIAIFVGLKLTKDRPIKELAEVPAASDKSAAKASDSEALTPKATPKQKTRPTRPAKKPRLIQ